MKRGQKLLAILLDGPHTAFSKQRRKDLLHHLAAGQHIRDAAGNAQIVLENHKPAIWHADQVGSRHADINVARNSYTLHLAPEVFAGVDDLAGDDPVLHDAAVMINVGEKQVESGNALYETAFDSRPFRTGDDSRQQIMREDLLRALGAPVHGKGDALVEKREIGFLLEAIQLFGGKVQ